MSKQAKKKSKEEWFDNSISKMEWVTHCEDCHEKLQFMYARKKTTDELWFCSKCGNVYAIVIKVSYDMKLLKNLND